MTEAEAPPYGLIVDPAALQRIDNNLTRAGNTVPDNPVGLKKYITEWVVPTMKQLLQLVSAINNGASYGVYISQSVYQQLQATNAVEGAMDIASTTGMLRQMVYSKEPDIAAIQGLVESILQTCGEKFQLDVTQLYGEDEFEFGDSAEEEPLQATPDAAPVPETAPAPAPTPAELHGEEITL